MRRLGGKGGEKTAFLISPVPYSPIARKRSQTTRRASDRTGRLVLPRGPIESQAKLELRGVYYMHTGHGKHTVPNNSHILTVYEHLFDGKRNN